LKKLGVLFWISAGFFSLIVLFAMFGPMLQASPFDKVGTPFMPASAEHWLGTDEQGRSIFARLAYGARISILIGLGVQCISLLIGVTIGVLGVYGSPWIRTTLLRITDAMFAFPDILLAILIIGIWGMGVVPVVAALSITSWPGIVRLVRGQVAMLKNREFVVAAEAMGVSKFKIILRHVLPQLGGLLLAVSMVDIAGIILAESTLSFLGIGVQPPIPSWGSMINQGKIQMFDEAKRGLLLWPCLALSATIFSLNFLGDGLRTITDPSSRTRKG